MGKKSETTRKSNLSFIQMFRGFAAVSVVFYHLTKVYHERFDRDFLAGIFRVGYVGVDFFFVLSGFIICYVHYRDIGIRDRLKSFIIKRFVRIYPIYWAISAVLIATYFLAPSFGSDEYRNVPLLIRSLVLFPGKNPRPLPVSWTLCYEIFFYLVFSLFMLVRPRLVAGGLIAWGTLSVASALHILPQSRIYIVNFLLSGLNAEFLLGCLVAYLVTNYHAKISGRISVCAFVLGALGVVFSWYLVYAGLTHLHRAVLFGPPFALLVLGVALFDLEKAPRVPKMLLGIGDASYSIYLTHSDMITIAVKIAAAAGLLGALGGLGMGLVTVSCVVFAGWLCYKLVEKPILDTLRGKLLPKR